jgi:hypothetical protein
MFEFMVSNKEVWREQQCGVTLATNVGLRQQGLDLRTYIFVELFWAQLQRPLDPKPRASLWPLAPCLQDGCFALSKHGIRGRRNLRTKSRCQNRSARRRQGDSWEGQRLLLCRSRFCEVSSQGRRQRRARSTYIYSLLCSEWHWQCKAYRYAKLLCHLGSLIFCLKCANEPYLGTHSLNCYWTIFWLVCRVDELQRTERWSHSSKTLLPFGREEAVSISRYSFCPTIPYHSPA